MALIKSQAHHEANTWVQGFQNPFDKEMDRFNREFQSAAASGQLTRQQGTQILNAANEAVNEYKRKLNAFALQGSDENTVAHQAKKTADEQYGPNFEGFLGFLSRTVEGLA
jgi:hypothetical protein